MTNEKKPSQSPKNTQPIEDLRTYWTPERMKKAIPSKNEAIQTNKTQAAQKTEKSTKQQHRYSLPQLPRHLLGTSNDLDFTAQPVQHPTVFPYSTVGKLFYTQAGQDYAASASVIYQNTILTAAHVLFSYRHQQWSQNILFAPAYTYGNTPLGTWGVLYSFTLPGYNTTGNGGFDVGMATMAPANISTVTGALGIAFNQGADVAWQAVGYPAIPNPPYDGERMWSLVGPPTGFDPDGTNAVGMESNFNRGASGGPWLTGGAIANGLSSYGKDNTPNIEFSPYFDDAVWAMYLAVRS
ncbi:MAG: hypothetical protein AAFZ15_10615 [Bacteroidota bacterium]